MKRATVILVLAMAVKGAGTGPFLVKPYLQLGDGAKPDALTLMWQTESNAGKWKVDWKSATAKLLVRTVALGKRHFVYQAAMDGLRPGEAFQYRVLLDGAKVFEAEAHALPAADAPYKFAVFGDCGAGSSGQKQVAVEAYKFKPDFVFIPGDIVYWFGLSNEYRSKFFPIYNAD